MKYKLVITDMDGTLLNSGHEISARTIETANAYVDAGGVFTVATGRRLDSALMCLDKLKINAPVVCFQGSLIADNKSRETLYSNFLEVDVSVEILKWLEKRNLYTQIYIDDLMIVERPTEITEWYCKVCGVKAIRANTPLSGFVAADKRKLFKILVVIEPERALALVEEINAAFGPLVNAHMSRPDFVEIGNSEANKGTAADFIAKRYGIKKEEVIAIGDSMNDLPMIKYAGLGVAMGNSYDGLKKAAGFVTKTNDEDGVAAVIEKFCFGR